jgi:hypothetical protein
MPRAQRGYSPYEPEPGLTASRSVAELSGRATINKAD